MLLEEYSGQTEPFTLDGQPRQVTLPQNLSIEAKPKPMGAYLGGGRTGTGKYFQIHRAFDDGSREQQELMRARRCSHAPTRAAGPSC